MPRLWRVITPFLYNRPQNLKIFGALKILNLNIHSPFLDSLFLLHKFPLEHWHIWASVQAFQKYLIFFICYNHHLQIFPLSKHITEWNKRINSGVVNEIYNKSFNWGSFKEKDWMYSASFYQDKMKNSKSLILLFFNPFWHWVWKSV